MSDSQNMPAIAGTIYFRDDIIRMARKAGWTEYSLRTPVEVQRLERFAALVAAAEREACAQCVEELGRGHGSAFAEFDCSAAIRARGKE